MPMLKYGSYSLRNIYIYSICHPQADIEALTMQEQNLDERINDMRDRLRELTEDENNQKWLYVTEDDIKSLPSFQNQTLIAIKAPHGTTLEVPDPDEVNDSSKKIQDCAKEYHGSD